MNPRQLDALFAEVGLTPPDDDLRGALSTLVEPVAVAPAPSADLLALFGEAGATSGRPADVRPVEESHPRVARLPLHVRGRRAVSGALVLAISGVGATGLSAAANTLPTPWQHHVSQFSQRYLPFDFPEPPDRLQRPLSGAGSLKADRTPAKRSTGGQVEMDGGVDQ